MYSYVRLRFSLVSFWNQLSPAETLNADLTLSIIKFLWNNPATERLIKIQLVFMCIWGLFQFSIPVMTHFLLANESQNMPSWIPMGTSTPRNSRALRSTSFQSEGTAYGIRTNVRWCTSCAAQTKMKEVIITLRTGYPGTNTRTPCVSAASQIWYWLINSSNEIRPNQAKKLE